jgi:hypothetical protein
MQNWLGIFVFMVSGALVNLIVAFFVLRSLANLAGVPAETNTPRRAMLSLLTILPVAGAGGLPFFILPFIGPIFGTIISGFVASMMIGEKYEVSQGTGAKIILPVVLVVYALSGALIYNWGLPLLNLQPPQ